MRVSVSRYGFVKALIPLFLAFYLFMVLLHWAMDSRQTEIYPFYGWALFSYTPKWERMDHAVILHAVDGEPVSGVRYLIPNDWIRDRKVMRLTVNACANPDACEAAAEQFLYPVVRRLTGSANAEFSAVRVRVDLQAAKREIQRLADGDAHETDFYHPESVVARWTMSE